jgi:hypothetical protein
MVNPEPPTTALAGVTVVTTGGAAVWAKAIETNVVRIRTKEKRFMVGLQASSGGRICRRLNCMGVRTDGQGD